MLKLDKESIFQEWISTGVTVEDLARKYNTSRHWMGTMLSRMLKPKKEKEPKQETFSHF